jgi:hypothetical protein
MRLLVPAVTAALIALVLPASANPANPLDPVNRAGGRGLVQPGMLLTRDGQPWCTGGFLFDGAKQLRGKVYVGVAAHCYESNIGEKVYDEKGSRIGKVAYSHWKYTTFADDIALVEVDRAVWSRTTPEVAGHPGMPTAMGNGENIAIGDQVGFAGWGFVTDRNGTTREGRVGVLNNYDAKLWGAEGPISNGDSGGPVVDLRTGAAIGSVSNYCVPFPVYDSAGYMPGCTGYGPNIEQFVRLATAKGFPITLRKAKAGRPR